MPVLVSSVNPRSPEFRQNYEAMRTQVEEFHARQAQVRRGGSERARSRHVARGKLLPRERVELLLDPGAPFLELSSTWRPGTCIGTSRPGASSITGIGDRQRR